MFLFFKCMCTLGELLFIPNDLRVHICLPALLFATNVIMLCCCSVLLVLLMCNNHLQNNHLSILTHQ